MLVLIFTCLKSKWDYCNKENEYFKDSGGLLRHCILEILHKFYHASSVWEAHHCIIPSSILYIGGFPGGAVVGNLPANAGDTGSSPGLRRSHMPRSNWAREPQLLSLRVWSLCSTAREAAMVRGPRIAMKSGPPLPQLEKALTQKQRPNTAKNK